MLLCLAVFGFTRDRTVFGRHVLATGGSPDATRLAGVDVVGTRIWILALQGVMCGIAGVLPASRIISGQLNAATGLELSVISACVLGGLSLAGGRAAISGLVVGVPILGVAEPAMNLLDIQAVCHDRARGVILLLAVLLDDLRSRSSRGSRAPG